MAISFAPARVRRTVSRGSARAMPLADAFTRTALRTIEYLIGETRLERMQDRPGLLSGFLASTGLDLMPFCNTHH